MYASGAIDLGELSDNPRDEETGTGILFIYASTYFTLFPRSPRSARDFTGGLRFH